MSIEEFLKAARAIAPDRKIFVIVSMGDDAGWSHSIHVVDKLGRQCIAGAGNDVDALSKFKEWEVKQPTPEAVRLSRIAYLRDELDGLLAIKASWACPECGQWNPPDVINCPVEGCGTPKAAEASKEGM